MRLAEGIARSADVLNEQRLPAIQQIDREEIPAIRRPDATIVRYLRVLPCKPCANIGFLPVGM